MGDPARHLPLSATSALKVCVRRSPGAGRGHQVTQVETRLPSEIGIVEEAVELIVRHCLSGTAASQRFRFNLCVVLSEALANAILCGNGEDASKAVDVRLELHRDRVAIEVTDEGEGFDPASVRDPTSPDELEETCGRGLFLIRRLADEVRFNPKGNSICLTLRRS